MQFSPIYDCESCLNPMLEDKEIEKINETEIKNFNNNLQCMSDIRKEYYQKIIIQRYEIIKNVYEKFEF